MAEQWDLLFMLPKFSPSVPTKFTSGGYALCSGRDPVLKALATTAGNTTALRMLRKFRIGIGKAYRPACFLVHSNIPVAARTADTIRAFSKHLRHCDHHSTCSSCSRMFERFCGDAAPDQAPPLAPCRLLRYLRFHGGARLMYALALAPVREAALAASGGLARKRYVE